MIDRNNSYFGSPENQSTQQKSKQLWQLVKDHPRFSCHGLAVGVDVETGGNNELHVALAHLTGTGISGPVDASEAQARRASPDKRGLTTDQMEIWHSQADTLELTNAIVENQNLSDDLDVISIDSKTPMDVVHRIDAFITSHGGSLPMGSFLLNEHFNGVCFAVQDPDGDIVGTTAATGELFWGMLATREGRLRARYCAETWGNLNAGDEQPLWL